MCSVDALIAGGRMRSADEIRDVQQAAWAGLSVGWEKWDSVIMDQLSPVGAAMIERLQIADDQQHLDIAAGTGEPGLSIAKLSPNGRVVLTDLAAEMLDIAARRSRAQGVANVETRVCSADVCPSLTLPSIASLCALDTCSSRTWPKRPPSSRACSIRADASARRCGSTPRKIRGRRSPCRQSRPRRWWRRRTRRGPICSGALPRDMSVPCTRARAGRGCRVGRRCRARDAIARAVLGDDQRARLARSCGASTGRRIGAGADSGTTAIAQVERGRGRTARFGFRAWRAASWERNRRRAARAHATARESLTRAA